MFYWSWLDFAGLGWSSRPGGSTGNPVIFHMLKLILATADAWLAPFRGDNQGKSRLGLLEVGREEENFGFGLIGPDGFR
jgi:hypothetical protein